MKCYQGEHSLFGKPLVRPAVMRTALSLPRVPPPLFEQTAESASDVTVHGRKHVALAVLEISIPAVQGPVHIPHDFFPTPSVQPRRFLPDSCLQLLETLLPWPLPAALEVIPQEIEATGLRRIDNACLFWMQGQSGLTHPCPHLAQGVLRLGFTTAEDDEVIGMRFLRFCRHGGGVVEKKAKTYATNTQTL